MFVMPFVCMSLGALIGISRFGVKIGKAVDNILNVAVLLLMLCVGINIGANDSLIRELPNIGFNCLVISLLATFFSIAFVFLIERSFLSLRDIRGKIASADGDIPKDLEVSENEKEQTSPLMWGMPSAIILGILIGYFFFPKNLIDAVDLLFAGSLAFMYVGVGISLAINRWVLFYIKTLGFKILLIPLAIILGSFLGGIISGFFLKMDILVSVCSALGMGYYSLSGAVLTRTLGLEAGTYGIVVNVIREVLTVTSMPLLVRLSFGAPIASAGAGSMDTMLVPITKLIGLELGVVSIISGAILTVVVPVSYSVIFGIL